MATSRLGCEVCGARLPVAGRGRIPRFCSGRCRVAAHRARRRVPRELTSRARWVRYSDRKVPLTVSGEVASSTDVRTWCDYRTASSSKAGVGLGFVLNGDGVICLDVDHCLDERGEVAPWAGRLLERMPSTYVEVSPSGDGLHVWGHGRVMRGRRVPLDGGTVEIYGAGRYITVTGRRFGDAPASLADLSEVVSLVL